MCQAAVQCARPPESLAAECGVWTATAALSLTRVCMARGAQAGNIPAILRKYSGKESSLFGFLEKKYACRHYFRRLQLDLTSPFFDPALALQAGLDQSRRGGRAIVPWPDLPALDNLSKCRALVRSPRGARGLSRWRC